MRSSRPAPALRSSATHACSSSAFASTSYRRLRRAVGYAPTQPPMAVAVVVAVGVGVARVEALVVDVEVAAC